MCTFIQNNWKELLGIGIGAFTIWKYFDTRDNELAWKRTEFIFKQAQLLDTDPDLSDAALILEGRHQHVQLADLYGEGKEPYGNSQHAKYYQNMDKLLNFLDRLAYATSDAGTLSMSEVVNFGWYFKSIYNHAELKDYCENNGFGDIIVLAEKIIKTQA